MRACATRSCGVCIHHYFFMSSISIRFQSAQYYQLCQRVHIAHCRNAFTLLTFLLYSAFQCAAMKRPEMACRPMRRWMCLRRRVSGCLLLYHFGIEIMCSGESVVVAAVATTRGHAMDSCCAQPLSYILTLLCCDGQTCNYIHTFAFSTCLPSCPPVLFFFLLQFSFARMLIVRVYSISFSLRRQ